MIRKTELFVLAALMYLAVTEAFAFGPASTKKQAPFTTLAATKNDDDPLLSATPPTNFREAEVLGLRLMQEGLHDDALKVFKKALDMPGSRVDIVRTKTLSGPSPVGGSAGGTEGREVYGLDEFELQAAYYNMACAYACLQDTDESVANLRKSFEAGFSNFAVVSTDPDLDSIRSSPIYQDLMEEFDKKFRNKKGGGSGKGKRPVSNPFGGSTGKANPSPFPNPFNLFGKE